MQVEMGGMANGEMNRSRGEDLPYLVFEDRLEKKLRKSVAYGQQKHWIMKDNGFA